MIYKICTVGILLAILVSLCDADVCIKNPKCESITKYYRTYDGSCNNFKYTYFGMANTPYGRLLPAKYGDGVKTEAKSVKGKTLPNARFLSEQIFTEVPSSELRLTNLIVGALQFVAHDLSFAKTSSSGKDCCTKYFQSPLQVPSTCNNIKIPPNDHVYSEYEANCLPIANSVNNIDLGCPSKQGEQISVVSHWLDLSLIYGNSDQENRNLRTGSGGLLKMEERNNQQFLPNQTDPSQCSIPKNNSEVCYLTGDIRVHSNTHLVVHTTLWVRNHNNVARFFQKLNPCWDDEKIFQETRKVIMAENQWITYNEMFPLILGRQNMYNKNLLYENVGHVNDYDDKCSPNVLNEMAQAAFRGLHVMIRGNLALAKENRVMFDSLRLRDHIGRPQVIEDFNNFDDLIRGMGVDMPHPVGVFHDKEITQFFTQRHLRVGSDLKSTDIHRARIHGIPSYNDMRSYCGLKRARTFSEFTDEILPEFVRQLSDIYEHPDDVDLTVGGQLEIPRGDSMVGPTFSCILLEQFRRTRKCDRFWFENADAGFTHDQLQAIKNQTMASFICNTATNIKTVQLRAFEPVSASNLLVPCNTVPVWNLRKWIDPKCHK